MKTTVILAALAIAAIVATGYAIISSQSQQTNNEENLPLTIINTTDHELIIFADKMEKAE